MRARLGVPVLFLGVLLSGCLGEPAEFLGDEPTDATPFPVDLEVLTDRILVSPPDHRMHEFQAAIDPNDPNHILVGAVDFDDPNMGSACIIQESKDGGRTWSFMGPPRTPWMWQFDPWVAIDAAGRIHFTCIELTTQPEARQSMLYVRSDDGGATWTEWQDIRKAEEPGSFDKIALGVGAHDEVFICGVSGGQYFVALSKDAGDTWGPAQSPGEGHGGNCNGAALGLDGTMYATFNGPAPDHDGRVLGVIASSDGGDTWTVPGKAADGAGVHVSLSVDPTTGDLLVGAPDGRLFWSSDGGANYTELEDAIPEAHRCEDCRVEFGTSHVDAEGRMGLLWTVVTGDENTEDREFWFSASADQGLSWAEPVLLGEERFPQGKRPLNHVPRTDPVGAATALVRAAQEIDHPLDVADHAAAIAGLEYATVNHAYGDYWGMASSPEGFIVMWVDHTAMDGASHVWGRIVAVTPTEPA